MPRAFRIAAKSFFLTYPQADRIPTKEYLSDKLSALGDVPPVATIVCRELHADGRQHFHAVIQYTTRKEINRPDFFDVEGHHPNVQAVREKKRVLLYVMKGGDFINRGFELPEEEVDIFTVMMEELARNSDATSCIQAIIMRSKTKGLRMYHQIAAFVDRMALPVVLYQPLMEFNATSFPGLFRSVELLGIFTGFRITLFADDDGRLGRKSLWLTGASRLGKTVLARSLGEHWYMHSSWNLEAHDDRAAYGIMDDIEWDAMKRYYKGILGCQRDIDVTDKYKKKRKIRHGVPVIVITNTLPDFTAEELAWLHVNVTFVTITGRVF